MADGPSVDTSTTDEAPDTVDVEAELEDMEVSFDDVEDTEETEETTEDEAATESEEETEEEPAEDVGEKPESEDTEEPQDEKTEEEDTTSEAEQKRRNDEYARQRIAEREAREKAKQEQQDAYLQDAEDARDLALRQLQVDAYNNRIEKNTNVLQNGIDKAVASIDLFRTGTPEVKEALAQSLDEFERMYVQKDANGDPVQVTGDVYEYLTNKANTFQTLMGLGARTEAKSKDKAKARTDPLPSRAPKEPKKDEDLDAFDEEANRW